jgi:ABC-type Fe3+ transport system permease subunit
MIDLTLVQLILLVAFISIFMWYVLYYRRKAHKQGKRIHANPRSWMLVIIIGIFGAFALSIAFVTAVSTIYFIVTGEMYPGQTTEDLRKMLGYCLVALMISVLFGLIELWETVKKFLPMRQAR